MLPTPTDSVDVDNNGLENDMDSDRENKGASSGWKTSGGCEGAQPLKHFEPLAFGKFSTI